MYSFLPLHPPDPASFERCKPRCARKTVYSIFNTPPTYFSFFFPLPLSFQIFQNLVFSLPSSLYPHPRLFRFEKWFHLCEFDRSFCSRRTSRILWRARARFSRKIISTELAWRKRNIKKRGGEGKGEKFDPFDALVKASSLCFRFNSLFHPV